MGSYLKHILKGIVVAVVLTGIKRYCGGGVYYGKERLDGKTVLITGANTGIGKETALDLAARGGRIIMTCRNMEKCSKAADDIRETVKDADLVLMKLDLASMTSIRDFAKIYNQKEERLDILINNAGVMLTPERTTEDGFELQFGTNHLGHFLLTNLLLEKLKSSAPSRVVTVSSLAHLFTGGINLDDLMMRKEGYGRIEAYKRSKLANVYFSRELGKKLKGFGVTTYSLHPGLVVTELVRYVMDFKGSKMVEMLFWPISWLTYKTPVQGAQTTIYCALALELQQQTRKYYSDCAEKAPSLIAEDDNIAAKLWEISEELVGLKSKQ